MCVLLPYLDFVCFPSSWIRAGHLICFDQNVVGVMLNECGKPFGSFCSSVLLPWADTQRPWLETRVERRCQLALSCSSHCSWAVRHLSKVLSVPPAPVIPESVAAWETPSETITQLSLTYTEKLWANKPLLFGNEAHISPKWYDCT